MASRNPRRWNRSLRLVFEDVGGELRLLAKQRVNMMPPPTPAAPSEGQTGTWAELRTANEEPVYWQLLAQMAPGMEVFSPDPKQTVRRVDAPPAAKRIIVVVPDTDEARALVFMGPRDRDGRMLRSAEAVSTESSEIARFDLSDDRGNGGR